MNYSPSFLSPSLSAVRLPPLPPQTQPHPQPNPPIPSTPFDFLSTPSILHASVTLPISRPHGLHGGGSTRRDHEIHDNLNMHLLHPPITIHSAKTIPSNNNKQNNTRKKNERHAASAVGVQRDPKAAYCQHEVNARPSDLHGTCASASASASASP